MDEFSREDFEKMKQNASERVMQMHKNRTAMPPFPNFVKVPDHPENIQNEDSPPTTSHNSTQKEPNRSDGNRIGSLIKYINIPEMMKNSDSLLLLGLILLLSSESADEKLILALAYILL